MYRPASPQHFSTFVYQIVIKLTLLFATLSLLGCSDSNETEVKQNQSAAAFIENNGLLVVEMESTDYPSGWKLSTDNQASGGQYLIWMGGDNFNNPGVGVITAFVNIQTPGLYRFQWRNVITSGDSSTDFNDSWLKISADNFYGLKTADSINLLSETKHSAQGHIVCPIEQETDNHCSGERPNGSGGKGWFKVWRTGDPVDKWNWSTMTSDNDQHHIMAEFKKAGDYQIHISGRSDHHGIDRFVLYRSGNESNNLSEESATDIVRSESLR